MELIAYTRRLPEPCSMIYLCHPELMLSSNLDSSSIELGDVTWITLSTTMKQQKYKVNSVIIFILRQEQKTRYVLFMTKQWYFIYNKTVNEALGLKRSSDPSSGKVELLEEAEGSS